MRLTKAKTRSIVGLDIESGFLAAAELTNGDSPILKRIDDGEHQRMRVLVVGARRDSVERLLAATRKAGLSPELVDLSAFAMVRALYTPPTPQGTDLGEEDEQEQAAAGAAGEAEA